MMSSPIAGPIIGPARHAARRIRCSPVGDRPASEANPTLESITTAASRADDEVPKSRRSHALRWSMPNPVAWKGSFGSDSA